MGDRATGVVDQRQRGTDRLGVGRQERRRCTPVGEREQHHMVEVAVDPGERRDDRSVEVEEKKLAAEVFAAGRPPASRALALS